MKDSESSNIEFRVLVLSSTAKDFQLTRDILDRAGIESIACSDLDDLCKKITEGSGAVLIVEEALDGAGNDKLSRSFAEQPVWSDLPVLVLASAGADSARVAAAMEKLGTVTVLERPVRIAALVSAVRSALRARRRQYQVREDAKALEAARDDLELRVHERTVQLLETNSKLEQKMRETEIAEQRAHQLLRELVSAQETERARIARDLHDELGQQLTSLRLHIGQLDRDLAKNSPARTTLGIMAKEAERIDSRVSFLSWMIRPTTIEELGLANALKGYVFEWSRNFEIIADFRGNCPPEVRLLPEIEVNVYRIAQECLNNISKYANATTVGVLLTMNKTELTLIVEDNGVGFDPASTPGPSRNGGLGIGGMRDRAALLNGNFEIESGLGKGTTVYVRIPIEYRSKTASPK